LQLRRYATRFVRALCRIPCQASRPLEVGVRCLDVMSGRNGHRVAEPAADGRNREFGRQIGFTRRPEILEKPRPVFQTDSAHDPLKRGAKVGPDDSFLREFSSL